MHIAISIFGLIISLVGAYIGSTLPFSRLVRILRTWGAGSEEDHRLIDREMKYKTYVANFLLVIGTALQIFGSLN